MIMKRNPDVSDVLAKAQEWQEDARETARKATRETTRYIEDNPWKAIAIVALCALALGFLLRTGSE